LRFHRDDQAAGLTPGDRRACCVDKSGGEAIMIRRSREHLAGARESYFEHLRFASTVGLLALAAGIACLIHAIVPALCTGTASRTIGSLSRLFAQRDLLPEIQEQSLEATAFVVLLMLAAIASVPLWLLDVPNVLRFTYTALAFALPATLLLSNSELDCSHESEVI
jgi:hypothetical protein